MVAISRFEYFDEQKTKDVKYKIAGGFVHECNANRAWHNLQAARRQLARNVDAGDMQRWQTTRHSCWNQLSGMGVGSDVWRPSQLTAAARAAEEEDLGLARVTHLLLPPSCCLRTSASFALTAFGNLSPLVRSRLALKLYIRNNKADGVVQCTGCHSPS